MAIRFPIDKEEFDAIQKRHREVHCYTKGRYTINQWWTAKSDLVVVEEWYDRDTKERSYRRVID